MKIITSEKLPIKLWLDDIENGALEQAKNLANLPFAFKHIAIMPDCHSGYGMPIGGVLATKDYIIPNAVGVDIGCGMCAVKTSLTEINIDTLKSLLGKIREAVPVGFRHHKDNQDTRLMPEGFTLGKNYIVEHEWESALKQLGTLGGGNHFIEIQKGSDGFIWIMVHSGSRNLGFKVANYYNDIAVNLNRKWLSSVPKEHELAFLPVASKEGQDYLREMQYCVDFALVNRELMMTRICDIINKTINNVFFDKAINIAHNYVMIEHHFGQNVWVHRKGATLASDKTLGIIPGSQGTKSYIVKGLGNVESFKSCSHGAGRKMGRKQAQKTLDLQTEIDRLDSIGVIHSIRNVSDLDEATGAYKPIDEVMRNQSDLVEILVELSPMSVIKG